MTSAADDLVAVVRLLVDQPDAVRAEERALGGAAEGAELLLSVAESDRGKVIGRRGRTVEALRALAGERGEREGRELDLEILDD
jgi:predicted RNA-binding protein YlqC (UPF0109 family)